MVKYLITKRGTISSLTFRIFLVLFILPSIVLSSVVNPRNEEIGEKQQLNIETIITKMPLYFIKNEGQVNDKIKFYAKGVKESIYITEDGVYLTLNKIDRETGERVSENVILKFVGGRINEVLGEEELQNRVNYFIGNDPKYWWTEIKSYGKVRLREIYTGIDIVFYGTQGNLQYDIEVRPGANYNSVKIELIGAKDITKDERGGLEIRLQNEGIIYQQSPFVYQIIDGKKIKVKGNFELIKAKDKLAYTFNIENYDQQNILIIDPLILNYSTFIGGSNNDYGYGIAADNSGNIYITGSTTSEDFPINNGYTIDNFGLSDVFLVKLDPKLSGSSSILYSTYIGGGLSDSGYAVAVDNQGYVYITGRTDSTDFPTTPSAYSRTNNGGAEIFLVKLNPNASGISSLLYSTYIGGSSGEYAYGIALDTSAKVYITGFTTSPDFPTTSNAVKRTKGSGLDSDVFITKLDTNIIGTSGLIYSTLLGGTHNDYGYGIVVDNLGSIYITGQTYSSDFPTTDTAISKSIKGYSDAFVVKIDPTKSGTLGLLYSSYLGGSSDDRANCIVLDRDNNVYISGQTQSSDFPITTNAYQGNYNGNTDVFITKLSLNREGMQGLLYSSYLGGSGNDIGRALTSDNAGIVYLTGVTNSNDFPISNDAYQKTLGGVNDIFLTKLNPDIAGKNGLLYATFLGGSASEHVYGIFLDNFKNVLLTGFTYSLDFPTTENAYDKELNGVLDVFIVSFSDSANISPSLKVLQPNGGQKWNAGVRYLIRWEAPLNSYRFVLKYSADNKTTWTNIATVLASNRCVSDGVKYTCKYTWQIPAQNGRKPLSFVRVVALDSLNKTIGGDDSDKPFVIEVLRLTSPNGSEVLKGGDNYTIRWQTYAMTWNATSYRLDYRIAENGTWKLIVNDTGNPGNYTWKVPTNVNSTNCRVRITLFNANRTLSVSDISDKVFTISP